MAKRKQHRAAHTGSFPEVPSKSGASDPYPLVRCLGVTECPSGFQQQAGGQLGICACCCLEVLVLAAARRACVAKSAAMPSLLAARHHGRPACPAPCLRGCSAAERRQAAVGERQAKSCGTPLVQPQDTTPGGLPLCRVSPLEAEVQESCR